MPTVRRPLIIFGRLLTGKDRSRGTRHSIPSLPPPPLLKTQIVGILPLTLSRSKSHPLLLLPPSHCTRYSDAAIAVNLASRLLQPPRLRWRHCCPCTIAAVPERSPLCRRRCRCRHHYRRCLAAAAVTLAPLTPAPIRPTLLLPLS